MSGLNAAKRAHFLPHGVWRVYAKHTRFGGDVDVVLGFRARGKERVQLFAWRRDAGEWTQLSGSWASVRVAVTESSKTTRTQVFVARHLVPLLDLAATLDDFPDYTKASSECPAPVGDEVAEQDAQAQGGES